MQNKGSKETKGRLNFTVSSKISSSGVGVKLAFLPEFDAVFLSSDSSPKSSGRAKGGRFLLRKMGTSSTPLDP